jgi:hypothetical protein
MKKNLENPPFGTTFFKKYLFLVWKGELQFKHFAGCSGETNPRIRIRRFESFCEFCGRTRRFESQSQGFESLLPGKKHIKLLKIVQNWATFSMSLRWQLPTKNICNFKHVYSNFNTGVSSKPNCLGPFRSLS